MVDSLRRSLEHIFITGGKSNLCHPIPNRHHRRSIRLKEYDYIQPGAYFITICTHDRAGLFGEIVEGEMRLNEYGQIVRDEWFHTAVVRPCVVLYPDEFVVMPNHVHGIIWIVDTDADGGDNVGAQRRCAPTFHAPTSGAPTFHAPTSDAPTFHVPTSGGHTPGTPTPPRHAVDGVTPNNVIPGSLGAIVRSFKSMTTRRINNLRNMLGASVWQRNYYEHIIRHERALNAIRRYILENPLRWYLDRENPARTGSDPLARAIWGMFQQDDADQLP